LTPFSSPLFKAQSREPSLLKAKAMGNSPPEEIGFPSKVSCDGSLGLILNVVTVLEPAYEMKNEEVERGVSLKRFSH
jgi:hypothetical protein